MTSNHTNVDTSNPAIVHQVIREDFGERLVRDMKRYTPDAGHRSRPSIGNNGTPDAHSEQTPASDLESRGQRERQDKAYGPAEGSAVDREADTST